MGFFYILISVLGTDLIELTSAYTWWWLSAVCDVTVHTIYNIVVNNMEVTYIVYTYQGLYTNRAFGPAKCVLFSKVSLFQGMLNMGFIHTIWGEVQLYLQSSDINLVTATIPDSYPATRDPSQLHDHTHQKYHVSPSHALPTRHAIS